MRAAARLAAAARSLCVVAALAGAHAAESAGQPPRAAFAVRFATLAERIGKLQAQVGEGVLPERSRRALVEAVRDFDRSVRVLKASARDAELAEDAQLLALLWADFRPWALRPATRENARKLAERAEEIAWLAAKTANVLERSSASASGAAALRAMRAATLAQRVPRLALLRSWGMRDQRLAREAAAGLEELRGALEALRTDPGNTPGIAAELQVAQSQFAFLEGSLAAAGGGEPAARSLEFIAKTGDHILESMERVERRYEELRRR